MSLQVGISQNQEKEVRLPAHPSAEASHPPGTLPRGSLLPSASTVLLEANLKSSNSWSKSASDRLEHVSPDLPVKIGVGLKIFQSQMAVFFHGPEGLRHCKQQCRTDSISPMQAFPIRPADSRTAASRQQRTMDRLPGGHPRESRPAPPVEPVQPPSVWISSVALCLEEWSTICFRWGFNWIDELDRMVAEFAALRVRI